MAAVWAGAGLALLVLAVFWPCLGNGIIDQYDDPQYVFANEVVSRGLGAEGLRWAFTAFHAHNWHPLTWLSHMLDVELYGLDPWGHHLTSVLLHAANAVLVYALFLSLLPGRIGAALAVAALFAVHPLRVESVAWIAERKDVLAAFFGTAALIAYVRWVRGRRPGALAAALVAYAASLASKPMLVTLPALLLVLEAWPLGRLRRDRAALGQVLRGIAPFAALSALSALATMAAQEKALQRGDFPLGERVANAAASILAYGWKTVLPYDLAAFYPHRGAELGLAGGAAAAAAIVALTALLWKARARAPYLLAGWCWYLVALLPVIGLVQVGRQGMADRYTYFPTLGLTWAGVLAVSDLCRRLAPRVALRAAAAGCAVAVAALAAGTRAQIPVWKDGQTLFTHARAATGPNAIAANALGVISARSGRIEDALALYAEAVAADPDLPSARINMAAALVAVGRTEEALPHALAARELTPDVPQPHYILGAIRELQGAPGEARAHYAQVLRLDPTHARARARWAALGGGEVGP